MKIDFETDPEMKQLRDEFIESLPERKKQLHLFHHSGNLPELRRLVHSLAGVAEPYGFPKLGQIAGGFDDWFESGPSALLATWIEQLDRALGFVIEQREDLG